MIKFFRKIRLKLLSENPPAGTGRAGNFSRYLIYAIGEIILVMVGILLALQVNNWNQHRIEKQEERLILSNLKDDFQSAISEFTALNNLRENVISNSKILYELDLKDINNYSSSYLDSILFFTMNAPTFNNQSGSLNVLLSSGKVNLISNQMLKQKLIQWPGDVEDMIEDEIGQYRGFNERYIPLAEKYISWNEVFYQKSSGAITRFDEKPISSMKDNPYVVSDYRGLLANKEFLNAMRLRTIYYDFTNQETMELINRANDIIELINKEIKK